MSQGFQAKAYLEKIDPYVAGKPIEETAREYGLRVQDIVKLASNENPLGMPESAKKAVNEAMDGIARYPDGNAWAVRKAIAEAFAVPPEWVIIGNGSDEILGLSARVVLEPGAKCVYSQYSFSVYELCAQENGAECVEVPARNFAVDLEAMADAVDESTRLVFITNPNNPTGLALSVQALEKFIQGVPRNCLVVLDEAYVHYLPREERPDSVAWVRKYPNVLMTRTFSKAYGLAGLRAGFAIARPELIEMINRIRPPFNMNALAQAAVCGCIGDEEFLERVYRMNRQGVEQLERFFASRSLTYVPTKANFILVHIGPKAAELNTALLKQGVIVRPLRSYGLPEWLRISVGTSAQNDRFIEAFGKAAADLGLNP